MIALARPKATQPSQSAFHAYNGTRHDTFTVTLSYDELRLLNRVREAVAGQFITDDLSNGELPLIHTRLEALDVLCDQLGLSDGPNRLRARECGARDPFGPGQVAQFIGETVIPRRRAAA